MILAVLHSERIVCIALMLLATTRSSRLSSASVRRFASMTPAPRTRPTNWKTLAPAPLPGPAFAAQKSLPQLPVPALGDTVQRLKESLRPLAWNEKEYNESIEKVDHFANNQGEELQRRLLERQAQTQHWLEDWWDDGAYFTYRDSVSQVMRYGPLCNRSHDRFCRW